MKCTLDYYSLRLEIPAEDMTHVRQAYSKVEFPSIADQIFEQLQGRFQVEVNVEKYSVATVTVPANIPLETQIERVKKLVAHHVSDCKTIDRMIEAEIAHATVVALGDDFVLLNYDGNSKHTNMEVLLDSDVEKARFFLTDQEQDEIAVFLEKMDEQGLKEYLISLKNEAAPKIAS